MIVFPGHECLFNIIIGTQFPSTRPIRLLVVVVSRPVNLVRHLDIRERRCRGHGWWRNVSIDDRGGALRFLGGD